MIAECSPFETRIGPRSRRITGWSAAKPLILPIASSVNTDAAQSQLDGPDFVIVGPLRAGTTMLRLMLHNHPDIALVGEFEESVAMLSDSGFPNAEPYKNWLKTQRVVQTRGYDIDQAGENYQQIVNTMWSRLASKHSSSSSIGCTVHSRIDRLLDLWPNIKLICLVRDPRDVSRSCVGMGWYGHPAAATSKWLDPIHHWQTIRDNISPDRWTMVRYEDLLHNPEYELTKCTRLLGVDFHPQMLKFYETSTYQQLDPKLAEQWKRKMPPRCAAIIDSFCMPEMAKYGYVPSTADTKPPTTIERIKVKFQDSIGRLRWRINRYGLPLEISWKIARHLPITNAWRMSVRTRINQINHDHLR